jgi:hypothetical protein
MRSRDSVVGIATGYWLDDRKVGVRVPVVKNFRFCIPSRSALRSTRPPIQDSLRCDGDSKNSPHTSLDALLLRYRTSVHTVIDGLSWNFLNVLPLIAPLPCYCSFPCHGQYQQCDCPILWRGSSTLDVWEFCAVTDIEKRCNFYELTHWSRTRLKNITVLSCHGTLHGIYRFITAFPRARSWSLKWTKWNRFTYSA